MTETEMIRKWAALSQDNMTSDEHRQMADNYDQLAAHYEKLAAEARSHAEAHRAKI